MKSYLITLIIFASVLSACLDQTLLDIGKINKKDIPTPIFQTNNFPVPVFGTVETTSVKTPESTEYKKCNKALPGQPLDLSIPDGTIIRPGEIFIKTWRLVNKGSCDWTSDYSVTWFSGAPLGMYKDQMLGRVIKPGDHIDITVEMTAPQTPGFYQSNWKLHSPDGELFGIGPDGTAPFWVRVIVNDGKIQMNAPTLTYVPEAKVYFSGKTTLVVGDQLDLDTSEMDDVNEVDVVLLEGVGNKIHLGSRNGAKFSFFGMKAPNEKDCQNVMLSTGIFPLDKGEEGIYLCYQSQVGLSGYAKISRINLDEKSLTLEYLTWAAP